MGNPITRVSTPTVKYAVPGAVKSVDGKRSGSTGVRMKGAKLPGLNLVSPKDGVHTRGQTLTKIRAGQGLALLHARAAEQ